METSSATAITVAASTPIVSAVPVTVIAVAIPMIIASRVVVLVYFVTGASRLMTVFFTLTTAISYGLVRTLHSMLLMVRYTVRMPRLSRSHVVHTAAI